MCALLVIVNMSGSKAGSNVNGVTTEKDKRTMTLTEKAIACKVEKLQKERQSKVHKLKGTIITLKELMKNDDNALKMQAQLDTMMQMHEDAISLHKSLMPLITMEEQQKQNT